MMKNVLLTIAYDGSGFHGWQRQPHARTVQGELENALNRNFGRPIKVDGTSRTDAGVHALGQRATFRHDLNLPVEKIPVILNNSFSRGRIFNERLPGDIRIISAEEVNEDFHARFDAVGKKYIYRIRCGGDEDIFTRNYMHRLEKIPDMGAMAEAAEYIVGKRDFKSFETAGGIDRETTVRTVYSLDIVKPETENGIGNDKVCEWGNKTEHTDVEIHITGDGFLYNMVRIITGTLIETGMGRRHPGDMKTIIESCRRETAGHTAPACGLYLARVYYDMESLENKKE